MTTTVRSLFSGEHVARYAQQEYAFDGPVRATLFVVGDNDTYVLETPGRRLACRVYVTRPEPAVAHRERLFELTWIRHLADRGVLVSAPLLRRDGGVLGVIDAPEGSRDVSVFEWAEGEEDDSPTGERLARYGQSIAEMHLASRSFVTDLPRATLGVERLVTTPMRRIDAWLGSMGLSGELRRIEELAARARSRLESLPVDRARGVLHGDCNGENHHVTSDDRFIFFDMDLCGPGWFAYDLGVYLWLLRRKGIPAVDAAARGAELVAGYCRARPMEDWEISALDDLVLARHLWVMGEHVTDVPCLGARRIGPGYWKAAVEMLHGWSREPLVPTILDRLAGDPRA